MIQLFEMGGPLFMSLVTIPFIVALVLSGKIMIGIFGDSDYEILNRQSSQIKSLGLLSLILGILGQAIGLFGAFDAIQGMADGVSPSLLAAGLKVSSITTIWGLICYILCLLITIGFSVAIRKKS